MRPILFLSRMLLIAIVLGALGGLTPSATAATFEVNSEEDAHDSNPGDGLCRNNALSKCTLRAAVEEANALAGSDVISLPGGTFYLNQGEIVIDSNITINGAPTTIEGITAGGARGFNVWSVGHLVLDDVTMRGFQTAILINGTAAISNSTFTLNTDTYCAGITGNGDFTLTNVTITENEATSTYGGGLCVNGEVTVNNSIISNNTAAEAAGGIEVGPDGRLTLFSTTVSNNDAGTSGGGISGWSDSQVFLRYSTISGNSAGTQGGAISFAGHELDIENSVVHGNDSGSWGGGIYHSGTYFKLESSSLTSNLADGDGGGIYTRYVPDYGYTVILNSTISGNQTDTHGGGLYMYAGDVYLLSSTIAENTADTDGNNDGEGGGVYRYDSSADSIFMKNTIIADNLDASTGFLAFVITDCDAALVSQGYNLIGVGAGTGRCSISGDLSGNQVGSPGSAVDPLLGPRTLGGYYTYHHDLLASSPAIDRGDPAGCVNKVGTLLDSDQRGEPRLVGSRCDIGAVESILGGWELFLPLILR